MGTDSQTHVLRVARITDRWVALVSESGHDRAKAAIKAAQRRTALEPDDGGDVVYALRFVDSVNLPAGIEGLRREAAITAWQNSAGLTKDEHGPAIVFTAG
jgi:hypothetical protein